MLYYIYELFNFHLFSYITVRAGVAFFLALFFTLYFMPKFIKWAQKNSSVQPINEWAPKTHQGKAKTPTMGGVIFISSTILASLLTVKLTNIYAVLGLVVLLAFMFIGYIDDIAKVKKNQNLAGLKARTKLFFQIIFSLIIDAALYALSDYNSEHFIPFYKHPIIDMKFFAIFFWTLVIIASSNAVNLTDGLDGLATVPSIAALGSFTIIIYIIGNITLSSYLLMPSLNIGEVTVITSALIGALSGFLWYNSHPAEVFMGDSGSLTLGAFLGYLAIISKSEILLLLIGSIFVIETLSVILQVGSYKLRKKRVFLMAPIHHHFEMKQWAENKIIVRFWIIAMLSNIIALITIKLR